MKSTLRALGGVESSIVTREAVQKGEVHVTLERQQKIVGLE